MERGSDYKYLRNLLVPDVLFSQITTFELRIVVLTPMLDEVKTSVN